MLCTEYLQLNQRYGAALRRWLQAQNSSKSEPVGPARHLVLEIEKQAFKERNAAYERMTAHEIGCPDCKNRIR